jgi:integrase
MGKRNRINLTNDISVRALKWKPGDPEQFRFRDIDRMGWYIRVTRQGKKTWEYRYPVGGGKYRYLAYGHFPKMNCAEALDKYKHYREQVKDYGRDPKKTVGGSAKSLNDLFDNHYIPRYAKSNKRSWQEDVDLYRLHVRKVIGHIKGSAIEPEDVEEALQPLQEDNKLHTARKIRAVLNKMFNWAASRESARHPGSGPLLPILNPCKDITLAAPQPSEIRSLKREEIRGLWNKLDDRRCVDRIIRVLLLTGCRVSEITEMHTDEIDWDSGDLILQPERTKPNRLHVVPLTTRMIEIIGPRPKGYIFPARSKTGHTTDSGVRIAMTKYCKNLSIAHASPQDLRETFISHMARLSIRQALRDRLTNHANQSVDGRHYNAYDYYEEKKDALLVWDKEIEQIIKEP